MHKKELVNSVKLLKIQLKNKKKDMSPFWLYKYEV